MIFKPQKVLHLADELAKKKPKLEGEFMVSLKLDGWYVYIEYNPLSGWSNPKSSRGRVIPSLTHLRVEAELSLPRPQKPCILIGEVIIPDSPFHITNGILNRSIGDCQARDIEFHIHDIVYSEPQIALRRFETLEFFIPKEHKYFKKLELIFVAEYDKKLWMNTFDFFVAKGEEGLVAKRSNSYYLEGKRNSDLLKLKLESSFDCVAVRLEESIGEMGMDGLTLVSKRANGTEIRTIIGKHSDKQLFRENPNSVIDKVVEIKCMEELEDGQLRQPVFKCIREDKLPTDIN